MKIKFENVGRNKRCFEIEMPGDSDEITDSHLFRMGEEARKRGGLLSSDVECSANEDRRSGAVHAGFHTVGKWAVVEVTP